MGIAERYAQYREEVARAAEKAGRDPREVLLLGVSKTVAIERIAEAVGAGAPALAENRPDRIIEAAAAYPDIDWHFIGNIQSRRIGDIVANAALIHSVFEMRHAERIAAKARGLGKEQRILLEVNVSGEESKGGLAPEEAAAFAREASALPGLAVCGLMTMAPQGDLAVARECFHGLRVLLGDVKRAVDPVKRPFVSALSMGMSEDWRCAIEEGATMVRIGRAIFSDDFS